MVALPAVADPTLEVMNREIEKRAESEPRPYLGASGVGHECDRKGWLDFHWASKRKINATGAKAIEDGHRSEELMATRLEFVPGVELHRSNEDGRQFGFEALGGHMRGNYDGVVVGLLQAPKTPHIWEHKCVNEKKFAKLQELIRTHGEKASLWHWDIVYYGQAQLYMHHENLTRHYLTVTTPGGRAEISCRTEYDAEYAMKQMARARRMIFNTRPLSRVSDNPSWYQCKWCDHYDNCHGDTKPQMNCRTCMHATPMEDGFWLCARFGATRSVQEQRDGCPAHLYHPDLIAGQQVDAGEDWVKYVMRNKSVWVDGVDTMPEKLAAKR